MLLLTSRYELEFRVASLLIFTSVTDGAHMKRGGLVTTTDLLERMHAIPQGAPTVDTLPAPPVPEVIVSPISPVTSEIPSVAKPHLDDIAIKKTRAVHVESPPPSTSDGFISHAPDTNPSAPPVTNNFPPAPRLASTLPVDPDSQEARNAEASNHIKGSANRGPLDVASDGLGSAAEAIPPIHILETEEENASHLAPKLDDELDVKDPNIKKPMAIEMINPSVPASMDTATVSPVLPPLSVVPPVLTFRNESTSSTAKPSFEVNGAVLSIVASVAIFIAAAFLAFKDVDSATLAVLTHFLVTCEHLRPMI